MELDKLNEIRMGNLKSREWTEAELIDFKLLYPNMNTEELANKLNRSVSSIHMMAQKFKIKKAKQEYWTRDKILEYAQSFYNKNGYAPKKENYSGTLKDLSMPSEKNIKKYFKGINHINITLNLPTEKQNKQVKLLNKRLDTSKAFILSFYKENNRTPTVQEYDLLKPKLAYNRRNFEINSDMSYDDLVCEIVGIQRNRLTKQMISDVIIELSKTKKPMLKEVSEILGYKPKSVIQTMQTSFNKFCKHLGIESKRKSNHHKDKNEIDFALKSLYNKIQRTPTSVDIIQFCDVSWHSITREYGSIEKACIANDIEYTPRNMGYGTVCKDKNGELCRSLCEQLITNFLIDNKVNYEKEVPYSEICEDIDATYRCDWMIIFNNDKYIVEYFGVDNKEYKERMKLKKSLLLNSEYKDRCIFITLKDLEKKKLNEIFKEVLNQIIIEQKEEVS